MVRFSRVASLFRSAPDLLAAGTALILALTALPARAETDSGLAAAGAAGSGMVAGAVPTWLQNPWTGDVRLVNVPAPDQRLWNAARVEDYTVALSQGGTPPLALMAIDRLSLEAPVYNGIDELALDRGLGRIPGMAKIHETGHVGISGHRDGFFRVLKDLQTGDRIRLQTATRNEVFEVRDFSIVDKHDDRILHENGPERRLTLVTCYPFYFVGHAPKRYIVHAVPVSTVDGQATPRP
ncbi:MAG: class D sortase [Xanthomonadales bacterium]|jgi:sortase A|nr:class D sortase [Xanthomonadales bacterium]